MNLILYFFIFLIGITFGSFFTLAIYRIPLRQDITHTRSYCPNCNHKLSFWDMIPVFSYIFLGGKCRYCGNKIRIRYLLLEILSGLAFVLFAYSIKLNIYSLNMSILAYFAFSTLYIAGLFIIAGIDKEKLEIRNGIVLYIIIIEVLYIIYLYIVEKANIYRYVIYLFVLVLLIVINNIYFNKKAKNNYCIQCLTLVLAMLGATYEFCTTLTITYALLAIGINLLVNDIKNKKRKFVKKDDKNPKSYSIPIGFYLCACNIIMLIVTNFMALNNF